MNDHAEVPPPWVTYPNYAPGDGFWRQAGEPWLTMVWRPYWDSLDSQQQDDYLARWNVPADWRRFYFDAEFSTWLDSVDDP
jgi:hypothetical protein